MLKQLLSRAISDVLHPIRTFEKLILGPANRIRKTLLTSNGRHAKIYSPVSNFVYNHSNEMPIVMLAFNSISILSSHFAQIHGLSKSNRENKDYLIEQEKSELKLNLLLTIIPPFILNRFLTKKLDSGKWTSKLTKEKVLKLIVSQNAKTEKVEEKVSEQILYNADHVAPIKEIVKDAKDNFLRNLKSNKTKIKLPVKIRMKIRAKALDEPKPPKVFKMKEFAIKADNNYNGQLKEFYNGRAYDEIIGQRNGILLMAGIAYTVIASNIIMPILKNKLTNKRYKQELEALGETQESIKRKKRYNSLKSPTEISNTENIFNIFSNSDNSTTTEKVVDRTIYNNLLTKQFDNKNIFNDVHSFNRSSFQSTGLKI